MAVLFVLHAEAEDSSAAPMDAGMCGPNAYYQHYTDGSLYIVGSGEMYDYHDSNAPWYDYRSSLTKIVISDNITHLGQWAFNDCRNLKELTIPITLNSVGSDDYCAFIGCTGIEKFNFTPGTDGYGFNYAAYEGSDSWYQNTPWYQCRDVLKEINFGDGVRSIGSDAFRELNITSLVLPDSVVALGCHCFFNCLKLTELTIPVSLNSYGNENYPAFQGCLWIEKFTFTKGNGVPFDYSNFWGEKNSDLAPWNQTTFLRKSIIISDDVQSLGKYMFYRCVIKELTIPISVECGSSKAFVCDDSYGYYYLLKVTITKGNGSGPDYSKSAASDYNPWNTAPNLDTLIVEEGVSRIGNYTFYHCRAQTVILPNSLGILGEYTFGGCDIKDLTVPISLNAVWLDKYPAFDGVSGLKKVTFIPGTGYGFDYSACDGHNCCYAHTPWNQSRLTLNTVVFEDGIKHIGSELFHEFLVQTIVIPDSVESLGGHAFYYCQMLYYLTMPITLDCVGSVEYPAFDKTNWVTSLRLTAGTGGVGFDYSDYLPFWCTSSGKLGKLTVDSDVVYIGTNTFSGYCIFAAGETLPHTAEYLSGHVFTGSFGVLSLVNGTNDGGTETPVGSDNYDATFLPEDPFVKLNRS